MEIRASFTDANGRAARATLYTPVEQSYRPTGFALDGSAEVTDALNAWLATVPDGATLDFRGTTVWSDRPIKVTGKQGWKWQPGTIVRKTIGAMAWPDPNPHLWFTGCDNLTLGTPDNGLRILGTNTVDDAGNGGKIGYGAYKQDYEFEAGVRVEGCRNFVSHSEVMDGIWGDGYQLQPKAGVTCDAFRITGFIDRVGRQVVTPIGTNGYVKVDAPHPRRSLVDIEPATAAWECHHITIEGCTGAPIGKPVAAGGRGNVHHITVQDNVWSGNAVPVVYVSASDGARRNDWIVRRNRSGNLGSPAAACLFVNVDNVAVEDNTFPVTASQSRRSVQFTSCGGTVAFRRNNVGPGGAYIDNTSPAAGQVTDFTGNSPVQTIR